MMFSFRASIAIASLALVAVSAMPADALTVVDAGNRNAEQPEIPGASQNRTRALKTTFDRKYDRVVALLQSDKRLMQNIKSVAEKFDIDPMHMIGAIVGEHTYNVDAYDRAQAYYIKAISYLKDSIEFEYHGEDIDEFITRPEFADCDSLDGSRDIWSCREAVWNERFRGQSVDEKLYPNDRFSAVFFQPFYAGQTFGIGQLNPLTALMMTDKVNAVTGARRLTHTNGKRVYRAIMDPKETLPYIAATLATAIDDYRDIAGFDISNNPGLTATLYNTGDSAGRARALVKRNEQSDGPVLPEENYYGWLINEREEELRSLLE